MPSPSPSPSPSRARELTEIDVQFISLVDAPANGRALVLKHAVGLTARVFSVKAGPDELRRAYGIVYPVGDVDTQGDTASAATVLRAADRWMRAGRAAQVDRQHSYSAEQAYVAESWIVRAGDPLFPDEAPGAWAVGIQVGDPGLWGQLKAGKLAGLSLAGMVETAAPSVSDGDESNDSVTKGWLSKVLETFFKGVRDVTSDEVKKLFADSVPDVAKAVAKALADDRQGQSADSTPAPSEKAAVITKGDLVNAVAEATATLKGEMAQLVRSEMTAALTKGAHEGEGSPMGEREIGGLL